MATCACSAHSTKACTESPSDSPHDCETHMHSNRMPAAASNNRVKLSNIHASNTFHLAGFDTRLCKAAGCMHATLVLPSSTKREINQVLIHALY